MFGTRMKRAATALLLVAGLGTSSCYGNFSAVRMLHRWNGEVSGNKFVNSLVFWALVIIPVYEIFTFGDAIVFNVLEFWTGSNPIAAVPGEINPDGPMIAQEDGSLRVDVAGKTYALVPVTEDRFEVRRDGQLVGQGQVTETGALALTDLEHGRTIELDRGTAQQAHDALLR